MAGKLILLRHGQSVWNLANRFTGWTDVDLTEQGIAEAREAGRLLEEAELGFDIAYTSVLKRAIRSLWLVMEVTDRCWVPVHRDWRLNERHYGGLQGLNKAETTAKHGAEQVHIWRRSYTTPPPALNADDPRHPEGDPRYANVSATELPATESLKNTLERVRPYWEADISRALSVGLNVLVAAHGNSLRAVVKMLDGMSDEEITGFNIPTGIPLVYTLNDDLTPVESGFLGDPDAVRAAAEAVANQANQR